MYNNVILNLGVIIILIIIPLVWFLTQFVRWVIGLRRKENEKIVFNFHQFGYEIDEPEHKRIDFLEIYYMFICPIFGSSFVYIFRNDFQPFKLEFAPTLLLYFAIGLGSYWLSRKFKHRITPLFYGLLPIGMMIGMVSFILSGIHLATPLSLLGTLIFPYFAFPLYALLPATLYCLRELVAHHRSFHSRIFSFYWFHPLNESPFYQWLSKRSWALRPEYYALILPVLFSLTAILFFFGQDPLSIIKVFTESQDGLFRFLTIR